ncbi:MAG: tetratricopeptide repeat protein [Verrucomicrobiota bacterium]|jgi:TolA-binding protein|nr:tetratricopeptide repeat protein [Verrucomicrobiota bacterium]
MNTLMLKYLTMVVAVAGMLGLTGCFAKHTVAKLWTPDQANLEVDSSPAAPNGTANAEPASPKVSANGKTPAPALTQTPLAKGPTEPVTYQLVQPATAVDWSRAKVQPDIYHLERDVSKALGTLNGLPTNWSTEQMTPKGEFETLEQYNQRIASMKNATSKVHYLIAKSEFIYNIDTKQFLVLPEMLVTEARTSKPTVAPPVRQPVLPAPIAPPPAVVQPAASTLDDYYKANKLYNTGNFLEASKAYLDFIAKHPAHEKILHVQLGLALCHFSMGQLDTAEPWLERLSTNPNAPLPATVKLLLEQCRAIHASGRKVKGGAVFELKLEEKPSAIPAPEAPDTHKPEHTPIVVPELPSPAASLATVGGLFRPWETPPTKLTLLHQYEAHPIFFKTGVLHVTKIRESFESEHKKEGRPGWLLPRVYEPAIARTLKGTLHLVVGCRLVRQPDSSVSGNYRDAFQLVSLHVISMDGENTSVHYATDLKPVAAP